MNIYTQSAHKKLEDAMHTVLGNPGGNVVAAVFKLSRLKIRRDNHEHVNIAANILKDSMKNSKGEIYVFKDGDIIVTNSSGNIKEIQESVYQIQYLFSDDPVIANDNENSLCKVYDAMHDWPQFLKICEQKIAQSANDNHFLKSKYRNEPLLKIISSQVEDCLYDLDWNKLMKVYAITTNPRYSNFSKIIEHICYDKDHLKSMVSQSAEMLDSPHLLLFIEEYIQLRVMIKILEMISQNASGVYLWELSLNTLASEEFSMFDQALNYNQKRNLIVSIHIGEVFGDLMGYHDAREKLVKQGYRICIHGLDNISFLQVDRKLLGADLLMLKWESSLKKQSYDNLYNELKNKIKISGSSRIIFSQCIGSKSLDIGTSLGINLYEGEYIERFL